VLYLSNAYGPNVTFNYYFNTPAYHGLDVCWTFPHLVLPDGLCIDARSLVPGRMKDYRTYLATFAAKGDPNFSEPPMTWTNFGVNGEALRGDKFSAFEMVQDGELPTDRCSFWQPAPYCTQCSTSPSHHDSNGRDA